MIIPMHLHVLSDILLIMLPDLTDLSVLKHVIDTGFPDSSRLEFLSRIMEDLLNLRRSRNETCGISFLDQHL